LTVIVYIIAIVLCRITIIVSAPTHEFIILEIFNYIRYYNWILIFKNINYVQRDTRRSALWKRSLALRVFQIGEHARIFSARVQHARARCDEKKRSKTPPHVINVDYTCGGAK